MLIAIKRIDGGVSIMTCSDDADISLELSKWQESMPGQYSSHTPIKASDIPVDKTYRNAWELKTKKIVTNMIKATDIQMQRIRRARDEKLAALDLETMKGLDVQVQKQVLRDIPATFDLSGAKTPEELKLLWPEVLK